LKSWNGLEQSLVTHPEVQRTDYKVGPHAYLGYGPLDGRGGTKLNEKVKTVVNAGECATLSLAVPHEEVSRIQRALWLMDRYGTVGGRSRNGWGSFTLTPANGTQQAAGNVPVRKWTDSFDRDWPHAIGKDDQGLLIWQTQPHDDWKSLMRNLAIIKIGLRTQFVFPSVTPPHPGIEPRHWLSYPITTHTTKAWDRGARLPNQLRFKVRQTETGKLIGIIFHMPHLPPSVFQPNKGAIEKVWENVHALLNELSKSSGRTYGMIADQTRRGKLKPELDKVLLKRIPE
jgi:CRISPR-associated protein Cmr1